MKEWILENTIVDEVKYDSLINATTVKMLDSNSNDTQKTYKLTNHPLIRIDNFTYKKPSITRCIFYGIKKEKEYYIYKDIKFRVLGELTTKKYSDKSLYSKSRKGTCFEKSIEICLSNENSKIVTAMCIDPFLEPSKNFIHSFVVGTGKDGKEYVLDGTFNVVIEKELYLNLFQANIISEIDKNDFCEFMENIKNNKKLGHNISIVEYFSFPNEVTEGIKKYRKTT